MPITPMYRLQDHAVRAGESTSDYVIAEAKGTLSGGQLTCQTPFANGAVVSYKVLAKATVNASGQITADITKPASTDAVVVLIFGKSSDLIGGF